MTKKTEKNPGWKESWRKQVIRGAKNSTPEERIRWLENMLKTLNLPPKSKDPLLKELNKKRTGYS
ncbi:MAG: hypothetical protein D6719_09240 [Candidatus Dadabacteria bacterium]|nr:MAG: hypothetical protein D6719_09240 [Candidatus Dadabacteria bacterium]